MQKKLLIDCGYVSDYQVRFRRTCYLTCPNLGIYEIRVWRGLGHKVALLLRKYEGIAIFKAHTVFEVFISLYITRNR